MFERWTERARQVAVLAQEAALGLGHPSIGTQHVLLGLIVEDHGAAAVAIGDLGLTADMVRDKIAVRTPTTDAELSGRLPLAAETKRVFELALREALGLGCNYVGTEHLLLALVREYDSEGAKILLELDVDSEKVRDAVTRHLRSSPRTRTALPGTRLDQRIVDALPDLRRAAGKLKGNAEIIVRSANSDGSESKPVVVIRRGPDGEGRLYVTGEVLGR